MDSATAVGQNEVSMARKASMIARSWSLPPAAAAAPVLDLPDAALVEQACAGDKVAELQIYKRHVEAVAALVHRLLGVHAEVEDAVQDTFVCALEDLGRLRKPEALRSWLLTIAVRQAHRRFRRRTLRRWLGLDRPGDESALAAAVDMSASPEVKAELGLIDRALSELDPAVRIAWMLRYVVGHRLEEIAELCDCSLATAKRRVAAADRALAGFVRIVGEA